jgi:hypothetical protein
MGKFDFVIYLLLLFVVLFVNPVSGASWVEYGTDRQGNVWSYDKDSLKHTAKNMLQVWEKEVFSTEGRKKHLQEMDNRLPTKVFAKLSYDITSHEINCKELKSDELSVFDYDTDGFLFQKETPVLPNAGPSILYKILCK